VADSHAPWTDDFAALGERTASQLRSIAATRAALRPEPKMSIFKRRPLFATLVAVAVLALAAPVAYAIGTRVLISIDPDQTAPEIEQNIQEQLDNAGVPATVTADKTDDGVVAVKIATTDPDALGSGFDIQVPTGTIDVRGSATQSQIRLELGTKLDGAQLQQAQAAITSPAVIAAITSDPDHAAQTIIAALAAAGFPAVQVTNDAGGFTVHVTSAPPKR
jgi:hypothetical protein